jgi:hypothetical protein
MASESKTIELLKQIYTACGEKNISILIQEFNEDFSLFFQKENTRTILKDFETTDPKLINYLLHEPSTLMHIASLTNNIYLALCENANTGELTLFKYAFKDLLNRLIISIINKSNHQLLPLRDFLNKISNICIEHSKNNVCILELPVGNSIPSFLLQHIFESKGISNQIVTISINRNDSQRKGITRKELIKNKINELDLESTTVIFVDEWISGANFYNLTRILSKIDGLTFIPCAFTTPNSLLENSYEKYRAHYNSLCDKLGFLSNDLFIVLPQLNANSNSNHKFIWAENPRLAGYRKLDFFGSISSTLISKGKLLSENPDILLETLNNYITQHTSLDKGAHEQSNILTLINTSLYYFNSVFANKLYEQLKELGSNHLMEFDLDKEIENLFPTIASIDGFQNAQLAIQIIIYYITNNTISPDSQFYYDGNAPICLKLEDDEIYLHSIFYQKLLEHLFND